jgi:hypothetical protein
MFTFQENIASQLKIWNDRLGLKDSGESFVERGTVPDHLFMELNPYDAHIS